ncbi:hypothetical protein TIFTF001_030582 [Ficus carica]|uniref:Uncharacterized protein n=1 Tax=Ficus carica TaxID=3494 RepID=A0AA88DTC0_FICCA|nr:hypothetical protein TIFTF001_030582 [Ficus carica]
MSSMTASRPQVETLLMARTTAPRTISVMSSMTASRPQVETLLMARTTLSASNSRIQSEKPQRLAGFRPALAARYSATLGRKKAKESEEEK